MIFDKSTQIPFLLLLSFMLSMPSFAKDVALEQTSVSEARQDYESAKVAYDNITHAVNAQEDQIKDAQARLKELQGEQSVAKARLDKTKTTLEKKQKIHV